LTVTGTVNEYPTAADTDVVDHPATVVTDAAAEGNDAAFVTPAKTSRQLIKAHSRRRIRSPKKQQLLVIMAPAMPFAQPITAKWLIAGAAFILCGRTV
ncbi:hypothetical protein, partial [Pedococcus aerophilus]|uniref:hypothetical protein n=1 Tax=Pedococcus aerophilus TaxID=436356 RepID=UPI0031CE1F5F